MISTSARHALRILQVLAGQRGRRLTGAEIARRAVVPAPYLAKILGRLRKAGFVDGMKGWGGGFRLSAAGAKRPVLAVLDLFGGPAAHDECVFGLRRCDGRHPCALHARWKRVRSEFRGGLSQVRVSGIAAGNGSCTSAPARGEA